MENIIGSIKEFIWDIIGFLIPGFLLIIILNLILTSNVGVVNSFLLNWSDFGVYIIVISSYIIGYLIYSLTHFFKKLQDDSIELLENLFNTQITNNRIRNNRYTLYMGRLIKLRKSNNWMVAANRSATYEAAKDFLKNESYTNVDNMKYNEVRNILMSRNPEMDHKVYTFMFRSDLFSHIATVLSIVSLLVIVQFFVEYDFLKKDNILKVFYVLSFIFIPLLKNCSRMFYSIAQRIPLSNLK